MGENIKRPFVAYEGDEKYIFVSYAHKDRNLVFPEIKRFHDEGYPIWYDDGLTPGQEWDDEIAMALLGCSLLIVFISKNSMASTNVQDEIKLALEEKIDITPIYLEDAKLPPGLRLRLSNKHAIFKHSLSDEDYKGDCLKAFKKADLSKINVDGGCENNKDSESLQNWNELIEEADQLITLIESDINDADPEIISWYEDMKGKYDDAVKTKDYKLLLKVTDRLKLIFSSIHNAKIIKFSFMELADSGEFANQSMAEELIRKGQLALLNNNFLKLEYIVGQLYNMDVNPDFKTDDDIEEESDVSSGGHAGGKLFEFLMDGDEVISNDINPDDFNSLYGSLKIKFDEFDTRDYSRQSDIPNIEGFLKSILYEYSLLKENFTNCFEFRMLSDEIAISVKGKYIRIINEADSFDGFDFNKISRVFRDLIVMAHSVSVKQDIESNLEQIERIKELSG